MVTRIYTPHLVGLDKDINLRSDIEKLNYLLRMEHNAILGYEQTLDEAQDPALKAELEKYRVAHQKRATYLSNVINALSGDPVEGGTIAGALHRNWLDLKTAATDDNAETLLKAIVFGERNLDEAYEDLLEKGELESADVRGKVARLHEEAHALRQMTEEFANSSGVAVS